MRGEVRAGRRKGVGRRQRKRHARGMDPTEGWGARSRAERTRNMANMFVTLDVSKLSGWLKAYAFCRVERRAYDAGMAACREAGRAWSGGGASDMHGPD